MEKNINTIGILGGSGALGSGLSYRLGKEGYQVLIGSRNQEKASKKVNEINQRLNREKVSVESNYLAAEKSDLIILAVAFSNHLAIVKEIAPVVQNKIILDTTVPLVPPKVARDQLPEYGSVAKKTQELLGNEVRVVSAFQNVAAIHLNGDDA